MKQLIKDVKYYVLLYHLHKNYQYTNYASIRYAIDQVRRKRNERKTERDFGKRRRKSRNNK